MGSLIITFAIYYLVLAAVCFLVVSQGQDTLYDEPTPGLGWKIGLGSLILTAMLMWTRSSFATMFTDEIGKTALQAILWFGVFVLIFRFHPWHGVGIGLATMLIVTGVATMGVESLLSKTPTERFESKGIAQPIRRPSYAAPAAGKAATPPAAPK